MVDRNFPRQLGIVRKTLSQGFGGLFSGNPPFNLCTSSFGCFYLLPRLIKNLFATVEQVLSVAEIPFLHILVSLREPTFVSEVFRFNKLVWDTRLSRFEAIKRPAVDVVCLVRGRSRRPWGHLLLI